MEVLPPEDALELRKRHRVVDELVLRGLLVLLEQRLPVAVGERRDGADEGLPLDDREAGMGKAGRASDDDHRGDCERADEEPHGDGPARGRCRRIRSEWSLYRERSRHPPILPGAAQTRLTGWARLWALASVRPGLQPGVRYNQSPGSKSRDPGAPLTGERRVLWRTTSSSLPTRPRPGRRWSKAPRTARRRSRRRSRSWAAGSRTSG